MDLDDVDRGVLHGLQLDARNTPAQEIGDHVGVSASTVRNRIERLEEQGVIEGYHPKLDYEHAGLPLQMLFVCTASPEHRGEALEEVLEVRGVVDVRETVTGQCNLYVEAVGTDTSDAVRISDELHETGVAVEQSEIVRQHRVQPFNHFGVGDLYEGVENGDQSEDGEPNGSNDGEGGNEGVDGAKGNTDDGNEGARGGNGGR